MKNAFRIGFCAALAALAAGAAPKPFVIAENGCARAAVVPYGGDTNALRYASTVLADYLGKLSGARFMVADKPVRGLRTILVGAPYSPERQEELRIRVKDRDTLVVTGDGAQGAMHAVDELLEHFGVVFCAHDFDYVPRMPDLSLPGDFDFADAPAITWRDSWTELQRHHPLHMLKLRLWPEEKSREARMFGLVARPCINQTVCTKYVPRKKFLKDHPDWYAQVGASPTNRSPHWVCISNREMLEELFREIDAQLAANPATREISVGVDDGYHYCECEKCRALSETCRDPDGTLAPSAQFVLLANIVGEHFAKKYPQVRFNYLGYDNRLPMSPNLKCGPNVGAGVAELWRNHGLPDDCNERSYSLLGAAAAMSAPGTGPYVWDYLANFGNYTIPFPQHRIFAQTARYYRDLGVRGVRAQHAFPLVGEMAELKMWLYAKLLWNPDQDVDALIAKWCDAAYGKGAPFVKEYIDRLEHARLRQRWTWYGCYVRDTAHYLTGADCIKLYDLLTKAVKATGGDRHRLARRARFATLALALSRYGDMAAAAPAMKYKLPSYAWFFDEWNMAGSAESFAGHYMELGEGPVFSTMRDQWYRPFLNPTNALGAVTWPRTNATVVVKAPALTGGRTLTRATDPDGTEFARFSVSLAAYGDKIWMNPGLAEIGFTLPAGEAAQWYAFATVRTAASVPLDPAASYAGIYQPYYMNGRRQKRTHEIANRAIQGRLGDSNAWHSVCLGRRMLYPGSRLWVMPGVLHECAYTDVRELFLVAPDLIEKGVKDRSAVIPCEKFDKTAGVTLEKDRFDGFKYARTALQSFNSSTLQPAASGGIAYTAKPADAGRWHVLLDVRIGAAKPLDQDAAVASVVRQDGTNGLAVAASEIVSGSRGDEAWQIVSLGEVDLAPGVKILLAPRAEGDDAPLYTDLRRIVLLNPEILAKTTPLN